MQRRLIGMVMFWWAWLAMTVILPAAEKYEVTKMIPAFDCQHPELQLGNFKPPLTLDIEEYVPEAGMYRVLYKSPGGKEFRALCRPDSLGKQAPDPNAAKSPSSPSGTAATPSPAGETSKKPSAPATATPPPATAPVKTEPAEGETVVEVEFATVSNPATLTSTTGLWDLPGGTYDVKNFQLKKMASGRKYILKGFSVPAKFCRMDASGAKPLEMALGPPLTLSITADVYKQTANIRAILTGREGEKYLPGLMQGSRPDISVKLKILDENGKTLQAGNCISGPDGEGTYTWRIPSRFKGRFKVETEINLGPFEVKKEEFSSRVD